MIYHTVSLLTKVLISYNGMCSRQFRGPRLENFTKYFNVIATSSGTCVCALLLSRV
jgi:hypothetical protein